MVDFEKLAHELYEAATPEERARMDERKRLQAVDDARPRARVRAIRTSCLTGAAYDVPVELVLRPSESEHTRGLWIYIEQGGITGYESMRLEGLEEAIALGKDWAACFGTRDRYDGLVVPLKSLVEARQILVYESEAYARDVDRLRNGT